MLLKSWPSSETHVKMEKLKTTRYNSSDGKGKTSLKLQDGSTYSTIILARESTLNIWTSQRGNSISGSAERRVSATITGNLAWKHLYFSCNL